MAPYSSPLAWKIPWMKEPVKRPTQLDNHRFCHERAARCPPPFFAAWVATRVCLGFPSRRGLTPRGSLECNPEIPAFPGEENYHHVLQSGSLGSFSEPAHVSTGGLAS